MVKPGYPLVTVIIPVYNAGEYLAQTINTVLAQTWQNLEIIIVDDGSTDNSLAIAKKHEGKNIKVFSQQNAGSGVARNRGIKEASGDYIQFLDADDLLSVNKIADQLISLNNNPGKVAVCSTVHFLDGEDPFKNTPSAYEDSFLCTTDYPADFLINLYGGDNNRGSMIQTGAWLTPANIIEKAGKWSEFYSPDDDGDYFCRVLLASTGIVYADNCFVYYRKYAQNNNLASIKTEQALDGKIQSFLIKKQHLLNATNSLTAKKALAHSAMDLAIQTYPAHKYLTVKLLTVITELGGTDYIPQMGGKYIDLIKTVFGWKLARRLQFYLHKLKSSSI